MNSGWVTLPPGVVEVVLATSVVAIESVKAPEEKNAKSDGWSTVELYVYWIGLDLKLGGAKYRVSYSANNGIFFAAKDSSAGDW